MVWSPFAKKTPDRQAPPGPIETIEAMRRRAKQRLIGSAVLVLAGLLGFPLLFETQPRPVAVDIAIEIPDKNKSKPLLMPPIGAAAPDALPATVKPQSAPNSAAQVAPQSPPATVTATTASSSAAPALAKAAPATAVAAAASLSGKEEIIADKSTEKTANVSVKPSPPAIKSEVKAAESKPVAKPEPKAETKPESKPAQIAAPTPAPTPAPAPKPDDGARAKALLDGKPADKPAEKVADKAAQATERFIVQVGAFADAAKAREVRLKVERAGLTTYTHVAQTKDGERTRVRVGPLATRAEAEKVANKIKALDLPAAILTL